MAIRDISVDSKRFSISYKIIDNKSDLWVLFLHGWGATKELMESAFGTRFKKLNHIYLDLPGFGGSNNDFVLNTMHYAKITQKFLNSLQITPKLIIAHSFGGKVATLLALSIQNSQNSAQNPTINLSNPPNLVLLSSAGLLKKQSTKVILKIKLAKIARIFHLKAQFLISADAKGLSQNMYDTFKIVVQEDFSDKFALLDVKTLIFWGINDEALPLYLGEKMRDLIKDSIFFALEGNHFFFLDVLNTEQIETITTKTLGL